MQHWLRRPDLLLADQSSCLLLMLWSKLMMNVRISIGPSSTTSLEGSTGPPRTTFSSAAEPCTFHFKRFFSMAVRSWFADKLVSMILSIWSEGPRIWVRNAVEDYNKCKSNNSVSERTFFSGNTLLRSILAKVERSLSSPAYVHNSTGQDLEKKIGLPHLEQVRGRMTVQNLI